LGHPEPDIGKEEPRGGQAVGRRGSVGGESHPEGWDGNDNGEAPVDPSPPHADRRSERSTDRGWG
jgi:hypothetical protein